jgi:tripartite-type tricarboxylate transporter receptor subunit TctC
MFTRSACSRSRKTLVIRTALLAVVAHPALPAGAQTPYPGKPIRIVVPFGVGGSVDTLTRLVGQRITEAWRQQVVVDVRPGAGSLLGTEIAAKSAPDGYTLMTANASSAMAVSVYRKVPYDLLKDFTTIGMIGYTPHITVIHPSLPAKTLKELIALARARPKEINFSSAGSGVGSHLAVELFGMMAQVQLTHVPYKGAAPAVAGLIGGEVSLMIVNLVSAMPHVRSGRLRALGFADSRRTPLLPDVPTMKEAGLDYEFIEWFGLIAPAAVPREIITRWNGELNRIVGATDFQEKLAGLGVTPRTTTPEEFGTYLREEVERYAKIVKAANVKVD